MDDLGDMPEFSRKKETTWMTLGTSNFLFLSEILEL